MRLIISIIVTVCAFNLSAQSDLINPVFEDSYPVKFILSLNQQNYTFGESIPVKLTLKNLSKEVQIIPCPAESSFVFDFMIYDNTRELVIKKLKSLNLRDELKEERNIKLYPDEEFTVTVDLNNWYDFKTHGRHLIQGWFYDKRLNKKIWSNPVFINLKPDRVILKHLEIEDKLIKEEEERVMTPEGTVNFFLESMKIKDWEGVFRYINWDKIVLLFEPYDNLYKQALSSEEKENIISELKSYLKKIPEYNNLTEYKIQNIVFPADPDERIVYAYVRYNRMMPPAYLNKYNLRRRGNKWYIWNIESQVVKTRLGKEWEEFDYNKNISPP